MSQEIYFDIETTGLMPMYDSRITCICAKVSQDWFVESNEDETKLITTFLNWLKTKPPSDYLLVSKNGKKFDIPFIVERAVKLNIPYIDIKHILQYAHFDIHSITKKWISLEDTARLYCCAGKTAYGYEAIKMWDERQIEQLLDYCKQDVIVLENVYKIYMMLKKQSQQNLPELP